MNSAFNPERPGTVDRTRVALDSVAISRLREEVRNNADRQPTAYNRMHNRHNR